MVSEIVICALATAGVLLVVWALAAALLLPAREDCVLVAAFGDADDLQQRVRTYGFLRDTGLIRTRVLIVDCWLSESGRLAAERLASNGDGLQLCTEAELMEAWKMERVF